MFVIERLIDLAARAHGFDRIELRRRNLITTTPHTNAFGVTYDSGDYRSTFDEVLTLADWNGFTRRQAATRGTRAPARHRSRRLRRVAKRRADRARRGHVACRRGAVEIVIGTLSSGQGHATSFAQLAGEWLGIPADKVRLVTDDSDRVSVGGGSHSGRSIRLAATHDPSGLARHRRQGPQARRPAARSVRSRHRLRRRPFRDRRHRPRQSTCSRWPPSAGRSPTRPTSTAGSAPIPMAGMSARSRSMPRPASPGSTATPRSTMSAAP